VSLLNFSNFFDFFDFFGVKFYLGFRFIGGKGDLFFVPALTQAVD